jgi:signal transduction histidine kinase
MVDPPSKTPVALWTLAAIAVLSIAFAMSNAVRWYGHAIPGLLVTADGSVSSIGMPTWSGIEQGLRFPDRAESIDGARVESARGEYPARAWDRAVDAAVAAHRSTVHVVVQTAGGERRELDLRVGPLDAGSWWLYAGAPLFMAGLYTLVAFVALVSSPDGVLARTFARFALLAALFFSTIFDVHTSRAMVPLFHFAFAMAPIALLRLALRLPDDVPFVARHPGALLALDAVGLLLGGVGVTRAFLDEPTRDVQTACSLLFGGAMVAFVVVLGLRMARARGTRRETLRILFRGTAAPYALVGAGELMSMLSSRGTTTAFLAIPALALAPIATGVVFVRHDVWGSRALLSRVVTRSLTSAVASVFAIGVGAAFATAVGVAFRDALVAAGAGAIVSAVLVFVVGRAVERRFFPAAAEYKPTIEQLSEELTAIADPGDLAEAVERTVRRWLPCERVEFRAHEGPPSGRPGGEGEQRFPVSFAGETLGWIVVGRKRGGALFTTDDLDLLRTIANQAALALAYALSYAELEQRRQQQAAAWQIERVALVETVAAEIAHEVRYPINFFRAVFKRDKKNARLDAEEIEIGCEEVDRLERLVSGLRRNVGHRIERRPVAVADLAARVDVLLRDSLRGRLLSLDIPEEATLRCDVDQATQVLVNLVANAIDAAGPRGRIGVTWTTTKGGAELGVWDDGPGFTSEASQLFTPWFTTKPRGTGLGLAITQRIVRAHGWSIDATRVDGRTRFTVSIPASDVVGVEARTASDSAPPPALHGDEHP